MRMDTRIPMMGMQPDILGAMRAGQETRAQADQFAQANALRDYYAQNGAGIMAGDNNALAGLAGLDPFAAQEAQSNVLGMEGQRQTMADNRVRMQYLGADEQRQIEEHAANMSANERAAAREQAVTALAPYAGARSAEEWYSIAKSLNQPELANSYDQRHMLFGRLQDVANVFDTFNAANAPAEQPNPQSAIAKLQQDFTNGLITQEQYEFGLRDMAPSDQVETIYGPDGKPILTRGPAGGAASLNVDEAKNVGFYERMLEAEGTIRPLERAGTDVGQSVAGNIPLVGNYMLSDEFQQLRQAKADFIAALLRRESGAVINPSEFNDADQRYFPQPGDSAAVIKQKREARRIAIDGVAAGAGGAPLSPMIQGRPGPSNVPTTVTGYEGPPQQSLGLAPGQQPATTSTGGASDFSTMTMPDLLDFDLSSATIEEITAWNNRLQELGQ